MNIKSTGPSADFLKRKAKFLKKEMAISHSESLNRIALEYGFNSWVEYIKNSPGSAATIQIPSRPQPPKKLVMNYHNAWNGVVI